MLLDIMLCKTKPIGTNIAHTRNLHIANNFVVGEGKFKKHLNPMFKLGLRIPSSNHL